MNKIALSHNLLSFTLYVNSINSVNKTSSLSLVDFLLIDIKCFGLIYLSTYHMINGFAATIIDAINITFKNSKSVILDINNVLELMHIVFSKNIYFASHF